MALPEPPVVTAIHQIYRFRRFAPVAILGAILILAVPNWSAIAPNAAPQREPLKACKPLHPSDGAYEFYGDVVQIAPMTIRTARGSNYFVKLEEAANQNPVLAFFIHGGSTVTANVPLGRFVLKYATGTSWCGLEEMFGPDTATFKANDIFTFAREFTEDGYTTSSWTVELIQQKAGNLKTSRINRSDF